MAGFDCGWWWAGYWIVFANLLIDGFIKTDPLPMGRLAKYVPP